MAVNTSSLLTAARPLSRNAPFTAAVTRCSIAAPPSLPRSDALSSSATSDTSEPNASDSSLRRAA
jgi:hypothetical protein